MQISFRHILIWGCCLLSLTSAAQGQGMPSVVDSLQTELERRMEQYSDDFSKLGVVSNIQMQFSEGIPLTTSYSAVLREKLAVIENHYKAIDMRWTTFIQAMQIDIADNEEPAVLIPIGYAADAPKEKNRKAMEEIRMSNEQ